MNIEQIEKCIEQIKKKYQIKFDYNNYENIVSLCEDGYSHDINTGKKYECDSSLEVWESVHKKMHKDSKLKSVFGYFNITKYENNRVIALAKNNNYEKARYAIGGDTDFNMEFKSEQKIDEYIKNNKIDDKVGSELKKLYQVRYCKENFSLLLTTGASGSLQLIKGSKKECKKLERKDNVCMFIYLLYKNFYLKQRTVKNNFFDNVPSRYGNVWKNEAKNIMCSYLNIFDDIYDYCKEIYKIYYKDIVDLIISFAGCEDYNQDYNKGISDYIDIIKIMWECKRRFLNGNI